MKRFAWLILPALLLFQACGGGEGEGIPENWKTYEIKSHHLTFRYPDNWSKLDYPDSELPAFFHVDEKKDAPSPPTLNVSSDPLFVNKTLEEYWAHQKEVMAKVYDNLQWISEKKVERFGKESWDVEYTTDFSGKPFRSHLIMIPKDKVMLLFEFLAPGDDWAEYEKDVNKVFESIAETDKEKES